MHFNIEKVYDNQEGVTTNKYEEVNDENEEEADIEEDSLLSYEPPQESKIKSYIEPNKIISESNVHEEEEIEPLEVQKHEPTINEESSQKKSSATHNAPLLMAVNEPFRVKSPILIRKKTETPPREKIEEIQKSEKSEYVEIKEISKPKINEPEPENIEEKKEAKVEKKIEFIEPIEYKEEKEEKKILNEEPNIGRISKGRPTISKNKEEIKKKQLIRRFEYSYLD